MVRVTEGEMHALSHLWCRCPSVSTHSVHDHQEFVGNATCFQRPEVGWGISVHPTPSIGSKRHLVVAVGFLVSESNQGLGARMSGERK